MATTSSSERCAISSAVACELSLTACSQNVLGHFLLTKLLLPILIRTTDLKLPSGKARIVTLSGGIYSTYPRVNYETLRDGPTRRKLSPTTLYAQSKFGNILLSNELARRYEDKIVAISLHPGVFSTGLQQHWSIPTWGPIRWMFVRSQFASLTWQVRTDDYVCRT